MNLKNKNGITLISLVITIIILLIITSAIIFNTKNELSMKQINQLKEDIELIKSRIDDYYLKYGELPVLCDYTTENSTNFKNKLDFQNTLYGYAQARGATLNSDVNTNDGDKYVVIDLEKLGGITLHYGYEKNGEYFKLKNSDYIKNNPNSSVLSNDETIENEIYVINTKSHQVYFPHGIFADKIMYVTF